MDKLYTFTACLFLATCIATTCTVGVSQGASLSPGQGTIWKPDIAEGYTIYIYRKMDGTQDNIHVNFTILAETNTGKICSLRTCIENQHVPLSDTCGRIFVYRQICNMSNACYSAIYDWVMPRCPTTNNGGQRCDIARINLVFKLKDGNQLNRTCIGPGELPCSCPPCQGTGACRRNCFIGCVCEAESKNCTPTTTITPMTNGTTTADTTTSATTTSSEPTITTSSGSARDTEVSTTTTDTTASDTATDGQDGSRQMGVLVGGVVGGLFGGVVITVVIVFLCRACRSNRRHTEDEDGAGTIESHTYLGLVSDVQQASSAPSDVYDVIKEGDDNQLGVDPSSCDQGDYVDITDDMPGVGVYSQAQAAPGMALQDGTPQPAAEYLVLEKDDPTDGDYTKLVRDWSETGSDAQGTYNKLEGKRSAEEEQEPYTKLGKATPERVRTP